MAGTHSLGQHFDAFIEGQLSSGRYDDPRDVLRAALRLMEEHERRLASLDEAIGRGLSDIAAGWLGDADTALDEVESKYAQAERDLVEPSGLSSRMRLGSI